MLIWNTYCFKFHVTPHSKLNGLACDENTFISTDNSTAIHLYVEITGRIAGNLRT